MSRDATQTGERCPTCDRSIDECRRWYDFNRTDVTILNSDVGWVIECGAHKVDWRAKALRLREQVREMAAGVRRVIEDEQALAEHLGGGAMLRPDAIVRRLGWCPFCVKSLGPDGKCGCL